MVSRAFLVLCLSGLSPFAMAQDKQVKQDKQDKSDRQEKQDSPDLFSRHESAGPPIDPESANLHRQNGILEERIKLLTQQQKLESLTHPDVLAEQSEILNQRTKLLMQQSLARSGGGRAGYNPAGHGEETTIESVRLAHTSFAGIAPEVAKALACNGKNVVLYGPAQSEALLSIATFNDLIDLVRSRLKAVVELRPPAAPDAPAATAAAAPNAEAASVGAASGAILQSVLDLAALLQTGPSGPPELAPDEAALIAMVANAATSQGCQVYWPDQYGATPFNPASQAMQRLKSLADLNDNGGADGKPAGLRQKLGSLRAELRRAENMSLSLSDKIAATSSTLAEATKKVETYREDIDFLSAHIKNEKNSALQEKLNTTFEKAWEELEQAIRRQLGTGLPSTIEDQNRVGELSKRMDLLKTRADWLAQYVRDEKDLALQDKLKRVLSSNWDQLEAAIKSLQTLSASTPRALEADRMEQRRWERYAGELKDLIGVDSAASEAYNMFRTALLDGSSGVSPLSRMLRAEALRDLTFDEKFQERPGSSVVQLTLQRLAGTRTPGNAAKGEKDTFSGGVMLSFMQYEPNGKLKNSGVFTGYTAPVTRVPESKASLTADEKR
jgi:hypothetical protein